jgi:AGCS family alanine or glycine:cation symporter
MRGLVSNEAGCGTAPTAYASSNSKSPVEQGFFGIFEVFFDTILLCTMTALVVIISYPSIKHLDNNFIMMTISSYSAVLGKFAEYFLAFSVLCFAFATVVCWAHYGIESVGYFSTKRSVKIWFILLYVLSVFCGSFLASDIIWELADFAIGIMTVINVSLICLLSKEVKKETELYFNNKKIDH